MNRIATRNEAIQTIILDALGADAADFNIEAIADRVIDYKVDVDEQGREQLDTAGYEQTVDTDEFWAIVEAHAL